MLASTFVTRFPAPLPRKRGPVQRTCAATLHHLVVALPVGSDEDDLGAEAVPRLLEQLDRVGPPAALLGVPEDHALGRDVVVDEARDGRPEGLFLVGPDPDEEPGAEVSYLMILFFPLP